jgi:hypothetical protein
MTFASAFEDAAVKGEKLGKILLGLEQDVARIFFRKTITEPLAAGLSSAFGNAIRRWRRWREPVQLGGPRAGGGPVYPWCRLPGRRERPGDLLARHAGHHHPEPALGGISITHGDIIIQGAGVTQADVRMALAASERRTIAAVRELQRR